MYGMLLPRTKAPRAARRDSPQRKDCRVCWALYRLVWLAMLNRVYADLQRAAMARSSERGFNGWYTYGFWYAAWTAGVTLGGLLVVKVWGPKLGQIAPPIKKGHKDLRSGEIHVFQPRAPALLGGRSEEEVEEEGR